MFSKDLTLASYDPELAAAAEAGLSREDALGRYALAGDGFIEGRGQSMPSMVMPAAAGTGKPAGRAQD